VDVDDLIIVTKIQEVVKGVKNDLSKHFKKKESYYCLGITKVYKEQKSCVWLCQRHYIQTLLERYGLSEVKPSTTLITQLEQVQQH